METESRIENATSTRTLLLFFFAIVIFYFSALGTMPLMEPDEGRYAEIPREMLVTGDFVTPHLNGVVYIEKPPLYYWGCALALSVFGENEFGARAFGAAVSVLGLMLVWWMGNALAGSRTGIYSAAALATSLYYYIIGRLNATDMTLGVMLVLAIFPAYLYLTRERVSRGYLYLAYAGAALAFLTKGLIGIVFPAAILILWALFARRYRDILKLVSIPGLLIFFAIALPWVVLISRRNPDFLYFFFVREHFLRYATKMHHRFQPFWFFLPIVPAGFLPWLAFLPPVVRTVRERAMRLFPREDQLFLIVWVLFVLGFFSVSDSKLITYMTPLYPPLALFIGRGLTLWAEREGESTPCRLPFVLALLLAVAVILAPAFAKAPIASADWALRIAVPVVFLLVFGAVPLFARRLGAERVVLLSFLMLALFLTSLNAPAALLIGEGRTGKAFAETINAEIHPGDVLAQYGLYNQTVTFYAKRRCVLVNEVGELEFGMQRASDRADWFPDDAAFQRLWRSGRRVFCIFHRDAMPLIQEKFPDHRLLVRSRRGILIVNR